MTATGDDLDARVLSEINSRTLSIDGDIARFLGEAGSGLVRRRVGSLAPG